MNKIKFVFFHLYVFTAQINSNVLADDSEAEFVFIKNQIVKQFYAELNPENLKKILDMIGCRTADCPTLIDISSIDFQIQNTIPNHIKRYVSISESENKNVTHSETQTLQNNSTSKLEVTTEPVHLNVTQEFDVSIGKTGGILCEGEKSIPFTASENHMFNFTKSLVETSKRNQSFMVNAAPEKVVLKPMTKMNVTFNFYQYQQNIMYLFDFELDKSSVIKHPGVKGDNVMFIKTPLLDFLQSHIDFVKNLQFATPSAVKLEILADNRFILRNFPAVETITNFGVDVIHEDPECIYACPEEP